MQEEKQISGLAGTKIGYGLIQGVDVCHVHKAPSFQAGSKGARPPGRSLMAGIRDILSGDYCLSISQIAPHMSHRSS